MKGLVKLIALMEELVGLLTVNPPCLRCGVGVGIAVEAGGLGGLF